MTIAAATYRAVRDRIRAEDPQIDEQTLADTEEGLTDLNEILTAIIRAALTDQALATGLKWPQNSQETMSLIGTFGLFAGTIVGSGILAVTSSVADSLRAPVGSPVAASRTITPFSGSLVSLVMPVVCGSGGIWMLGGIVVVMAASRISIWRTASR